MLRMHRLFTIIAICTVASAPAARAASELSQALAAVPDRTNGELIYRTCAACHGDDGGGVADGTVPAIGGMPAKLVTRQLVNFRQEQRSDIRMEHFSDARHLGSPQAIADVASYVEGLVRRTPGGIGDGRSLQAGARAFLRRCADCHGALGRASTDGRMPSLAGQHQAYLERQLRDAAAGRRPSMNATHRSLVRALSDEELRGVTDYLSRMAPLSGPRGP